MDKEITIILIIAFIILPIGVITYTIYQMEKMGNEFGCGNLYIPLSNNEVFYNCIDRAIEKNITSLIERENERIKIYNEIVKEMEKLELKIFILEQLKLLNATQGKSY